MYCDIDKFLNLLNIARFTLTFPLGSCLEQFQLMPFMQCSSSDVCRHGVRTDKSFWLAAGEDADFAVKPMNNIDVITQHISRCNVCVGTRYILARHSFTADSPDCPADFSPLWTGYSYVMVSFE